MAGYRIGTADPTFPAETGSGVWGCQPRTADMVAWKTTVIMLLPQAGAVIGIDAAAHMNHYLGNSGRMYTIRFEHLLHDVASARPLYDNELAEAKAFVERLPPGTHSITSTSGSQGHASQYESRNWYYAVAGFTVWGKGIAHVRETVDGQRGYHLDFELKFNDRYDWHVGNGVHVLGVEITYELMGRLHRQGLAREYEMTGSVTNRVTWGAAAAVRGQATGVHALLR